MSANPRGTASKALAKRVQIAPNHLKITQKPLWRFKNHVLPVRRFWSILFLVPALSLGYIAPLAFTRLNMGIYDVDHDSEPRSLIGDRPQLPYLLPMLAFGLVMSIKTLPPIAGINFKTLMHTWYPVEYTAKSLLAAALLVYFWKYYTKIKWTHLRLGLLVGIIGVFQWILTEYGMQWVLAHFHFFKPLTPDQMTYVPTTEIPDVRWRIVYYCLRIGLPALVVPVMEELLWRDFMMRALIRGGRFQEVAVGTFTWLSFIGTAILFSLVHVQYVTAIVWAMMIGWLLIRTKSIGACIVAHGTTNLLLGLYVVFTGDWQFW